MVEGGVVAGAAIVSDAGAVLAVILSAIFACVRHRTGGRAGRSRRARR